MKTCFRKTLTRVRSNEEGGVALSLILLMPVLILAVGLVVDTATKYQGNERASQVAQSAANAAANAVSGSVQESATPGITAAAAEAVARNYVVAAGLTPTVASASANNVDVTATGTVSTKFLSMLGIASLPIKGSAHASLFAN